MQIKMHEIESHVARPRIAHERVRVRAVVIHQPARSVHGGGQFVDVILEQSERVRIGHHADGRIVSECGFELLEPDPAALVAFE